VARTIGACAVAQLAQLAQLAATMRQTPPVLAFSERGLNDGAAYRGCQTPAWIGSSAGRLFRI
jgi:hypothetical protein